MTQDNWKTLRVPPEAYETAKQRKESQNQTWGEYLMDTNRSAPDADDVAHEITAQLNLDASDAKDEIQEVQELVNDASNDIEELKDHISMANEPGVEGDTKRIINRIDDLESQLPAKIAEELQR